MAKERRGLRVYGLQMQKDGPKMVLRVHNSQFNFNSGYGDFRFLDDWVDDSDPANPKIRKFDRIGMGKGYPVQISADRARLLSASIEAHRPLMTPHTVVKHEPEFAGIDCIVVGPGPSSAGIVDRLKAFAASGRMHRPFATVALNRAGMIPDLHPSFFMCLDAHSKPEWWHGLSPKETVLITCPMAPPELAEYWKPKDGSTPNCRYFYLRDCGQPEHPAFAPLPMMSGVYSVSIVSVHVLASMGFKRIFYVGLDMSCIMDDKPAANGAIDMVMYGDGTKGSQTYMNGSMMIETVGLDGKICLAETQFFQQREAMILQMEMATEVGVEVYNSSGQGILGYRAFGLEDGLARPLEESTCRSDTLPPPTRTDSTSGVPSTQSAPPSSASHSRPTPSTPASVA